MPSARATWQSDKEEPVLTFIPSGATLVARLCRRVHLSRVAFHRLRRTLAGMGESAPRKLGHPGDGNRRLKTLRLALPDSPSVSDIGGGRPRAKVETKRSRDRDPLAD